MVCTVRASTEPTAGEAGSGHGLHTPQEGPCGWPTSLLRYPETGWAGGGPGGTWSDGLQQEGHGCREAEDGDEVEHVQQQPCLLCQGTLGWGSSTQPGPTPRQRAPRGKAAAGAQGCCSPPPDASPPGTRPRQRRWPLWTEAARAGSGPGLTRPQPKTPFGARLTNKQAQGGPAVGVLQKQGHHLDGVHQDAIPGGGGAGLSRWEGSVGREGQAQGPGDSTHLMRFSKNNRALLKTCERGDTPSAQAPAPALLVPVATAALGSNLGPAGPAGATLSQAERCATNKAPTPVPGTSLMTTRSSRRDGRPAALICPAELQRAPRPQLLRKQPPCGRAVSCPLVSPDSTQPRAGAAPAMERSGLSWCCHTPSPGTWPQSSFQGKSPTTAAPGSSLGRGLLPPPPHQAQARCRAHDSFSGPLMLAKGHCWQSGKAP